MISLVAQTEVYYNEAWQLTTPFVRYFYENNADAITYQFSLSGIEAY